VDGSRARRPVVGIVGYLLDAAAAEQRQFGRRDLNVFALNYFHRALAVGLLPVGLPAVAPESAAAYCDLVEGLVLTGGSDVDPRFYGEEPEAGLGPTVVERDEFELALTREALARGLPILGICRGMQLLNVAMAGALRQDLRRDDGIAHGTGSFHPAYHEIEVLHPALAGPTGSRLRVNSLHHQAVSRVAAGLEVAGRADDGVIEAVVGAECPVLGVQWHPEQLPAGDLAGDGPFAWLRDRLAASPAGRA
jgi:putative glutamine amidotransferase